MAITLNSTKTLLKSGAALVVCLGLAAALTPKPAEAGGKGAILFGAGVVTGVIVNEAIRNSHRPPPPPRHRPRRNPQPRAHRTIQRSTPAYGYNHAEAIKIQTALNDLGYNAGAVDGIIGNGTMAAIRTFQIEIDSDPTGRLTEKQKIILFDRAKVAAAGDDRTLASNRQQGDGEERDAENERSSDNRDTADTKTSSYDWTKVQQALNVLGYPAGTENGRMTEDTREAIKAFQIDLSNEATGVLTAEEQSVLFNDAADLARDDTGSGNDAVVERDQNTPVKTEGEKVVLLGSDEPDNAGPGATDNLVLTEYRAVSSITDPLNQLQAVREARRSPPSFVSGLSATERLSRESQLSQLEADVKRELLTPVVEKAEAAPVSVAGVRQIASLENDAEAIFGVIGAEESQPYRNRLQSRQQQILDALMSDRLEELNSYPQTLDGLKQSAAWHKRFLTDYSDFEGNPAVADALSAFEADRADRLAAMFPTFERDVASMSNPAEGAPDLMSSYLSWTGDESLPISLEYKFVVAQHR